MFRRQRDELSFWPALADLVLAVLLLVMILWMTDLIAARNDPRVKKGEMAVRISDWKRMREIMPDEVVISKTDLEKMIELNPSERMVKTTDWERMREIAPDERVVNASDWERRHEIAPDEMVVKAADWKKRPDKPMIIPLEEASGFAFEPGHADLPDVFKAKLNADIVPRIISIVADYPDYPIEMEVVGHTDGKPKGGSSNLDSLLNGFTLDANAEGKIAKLESGSNADLGMARALSVSAFLHTRFLKSGNAKLEVIACRAYSGAQLISPAKNLIEGAINEDVPSRRRIELRFTQKHAQP